MISITNRRSETTDRQSAVFLVPGSIDTRTGGSIYDRRVAEALRRLGWSIEVRELDGTFPFPTQSALAHAGRTLEALGDHHIVVVDGLVFGAIPDAVERMAPRLRLVALVHLPLAADVSLDRATAASVEASERRALAAAALVVATSAATVPMLARYDLPNDRLVIVAPGTDRVPVARGSRGSQIHLLSVAALHAGKGHEILLRALAEVSHRNWRLTCAGSVTRDAATAARVRDTARKLGLDQQVSLPGELDDVALGGCYDGADVFVLATLQETYSMAVAEALARGLPVVGTATGAIPDLVGDEAGLVVPPGDAEALAGALTCVLGDAALRARLADGARRVRDQLPSWEETARQMSDALAAAGSR